MIVSINGSASAGEPYLAALHSQRRLLRVKKCFSMPFWRILVTRRTLPLLFTGAIAIACGSIEAVAQPVGTTTKVVQTRSGAVAGDGSDILAFKGIPYAAPPVGPLRWKPPAPSASWEGVRAA